MTETTEIKTRSGLTFTADVEGPVGGPLVLRLHGFPESRHSWRAALPALAAAGYRAVAPDQRGYSPGARPDPTDLSNYAFDRLIGDAIEIAAAAGYEGKRFHQVGHDWGGQVSWGVRALAREDGARVPTSLAVFRVQDDGTLEYVRHYPVSMDERTLFWMGLP